MVCFLGRNHFGCGQLGGFLEEVIGFVDGGFARAVCIQDGFVGVANDVPGFIGFENEIGKVGFGLPGAGGISPGAHIQDLEPFTGGNEGMSSIACSVEPVVTRDGHVTLELEGSPVKDCNPAVVREGQTRGSRRGAGYGRAGTGGAGF